MKTLLLLLALLAPAAPARADWSWNGLKDLFTFKKQDAPAAQAPGGASLKIVSWNMQTIGAHVDPADRAAFSTFFKEVFSDPAAKVLAAQEIANQRGSDAVMSMLGNENGKWKEGFEDTGDAMDNAFYVKEGAVIECQRRLFDDAALSKHPAQLAHMRVGDFDFTLITVHLNFKSGRSDLSAEELRHVLDWLREHLNKPGADPDVIVAGDFNMPTTAGRELSERHSASVAAVDAVVDEYPMFRGGNLVTLVDEPTSRSKDGGAANNYDHFIMTGHLFHGAYVKGSAGRVPPAILDRLRAIEAANNTRVSDHFPIWADFRTGGAGGDGQAIRPDGAATCGL